MTNRYKTPYDDVFYDMVSRFLSSSHSRHHYQRVFFSRYEGRIEKNGFFRDLTIARKYFISQYTIESRSVTGRTRNPPIAQEMGPSSALVFSKKEFLDDVKKGEERETL